MESNRYFWVGPIGLAPGSVVEPGNWGRIIRAIPGHFAATRELVFEATRARDFSHLPSRFDAAFVFCSELELQTFLEREPRPLDLSYEVELSTPSLPSHIGDVGLLGPPGDSIVMMETRAQTYWSSELAGDISELITLSPLHILRRL